MNISISHQRNLIAFAVPLLMILGLTYLAGSEMFWNNPNSLSFGITFDFLITVPLVYFLLIRKTKIPKLTTYVFLLGGLVIAGWALPADYQFYQSLAKKWFLPVFEGGILLVVLTKLAKGVRTFRQHKSSYDFFTVLKSSCEEVLPGKVIAAFATEVAVFYYGFINWKVSKPKPNEFSYHKESGITVVLIAVIFMIAAETFIIHILVAKWSEMGAWVPTIISIYTAVQVFAFLKSISKRYTSIENGTLHLRYGILCETSIDLENIESVEISSSDIPENSPIKKFSAFGSLEGHNIIIKLKEAHVMTGPYGFKVKFKELALFIDDKREFIKQIKASYIN